MNYIENKIKFKEKYSDIEIDDILNNFVTKDYIPHDYKECLKNMSNISKNEIIKLCLDFFEKKYNTLLTDVEKIIENITFINEKDLDYKITDNGKTFYNNGIISCTIFLQNNLYDLFILVHELTHYLTMLHPRKEEYIEEYLLFSEVFPFRMEEELTKYLFKNKCFVTDLKKCINAREVILKNIVKQIYDYKDNIIEDIDFKFRYIISILYKNKVKISLSEGIYNLGILNIKDIIDFSI